MDHKRAVESQAVERYLLGEMEPEERDRFEEHFFTCDECAEEVRVAARFEAAARKVLPEFPKKEARKARFSAMWWRPPALAWATAALAVAVVYQGAIQVPGLKRQLRPQSVPSVALHAATRGDSDLPRIPASTGLFTVYFELAGQSSQTSYQCELTDSRGEVVDRFEVPAPKPGDPLNVLLNRSRLSAGRYALTVTNAADTQGLRDQFLFVVE